MTVWEDPSFDEISVKQPCGCQSRYSCGPVGLRWPWHAEGGHGTANLPHQILTQLQGVARSLTDVGQKTLGWSLLYFFPQSHCSLPVHTPLETLAFRNSFCISKHDLHCAVWGSVRVHLDPAAGYSRQDQGRIKLPSELRDCCAINLTCIFLCQVWHCALVHSLQISSSLRGKLQTQALMLNVYLRAWESMALFPLNLGRDTFPGWGLFDVSADFWGALLLFAHFSVD